MNEMNANAVSKRPDDARVQKWSIDFDYLLADSVGIKIFSEFLKNEFCYENIQFWIMCENFKKLQHNDDMRIYAKEIFDKFLSADANDPINVDNNARIAAERGIDNPNHDIFDSAQKQIYDLMKFDCYKRFINSDIFNQWLQMECMGKRLPLKECADEINIKPQLKVTKPKVEKRRKKKSFRPWGKEKSYKLEDINMNKENMRGVRICKITNDSPVINDTNTLSLDLLSSCGEDLSFSDYSKSENVFTNIMIASQHVPQSNDSVLPSLSSLLTKPNHLTPSESNPYIELKTCYSKRNSAPQTYSQILNKSDRKFSKFNLSPLENDNSNETTIVYDLNATTKQLQKFKFDNTHVNFDLSLTPSNVPYPEKDDEIVVHLPKAEFTPPTPLNQISQFRNNRRNDISKARVRLYSNCPPLPPKGQHQYPPPRPISRSKTNESLIVNDNDYSDIICLEHSILV